MTYTYMNKDSTQVVKDSTSAQSRAVRKLVCVSFVCIIFMLAEVVGGYIANSLSIMTDAAHMFSDLCGFGISMASLFITKRQATRKMSYGYHRAEVLGASLSVLLIWGLTIWLLVEAVKRIINPEEVDGLIMLIVAGAGLLSNIVMGKILHSHGGGGEDHRVLSHVMLHPEDAPRLTSVGRQHRHHDHDHEHHDHEHHDHEHHDHEHHDHEHHDHEHHDHEHHDHEHHDHEHHDHEHTHDHEHGHDHDHKKKAKKGHDHGHSHFGHHHHGHGHDHENMNIRAALIHVIGDLCQSIGVTIAGLIIYLKPELHIIDPICTFLFSIIVFMTTIPIIKDCVRIIMEATPPEIDSEALIEELQVVRIS
jgi:solute carrier family 30 (zinc transporter), member 2